MSSVIELSKKEPGWMFVETIDPGWRDKCAVLFALCHPVKGIFLLDEIYQSGLTVPKISSLVKSIEYHKFENRKVDKRMYDPNHIRKTTQESPVANYKLWKDSGLPGEPAFHSRDRSYDRMFELLSRGLIAYAPISCTGLDRELRVHRKDSSGVPEEKGSNHCFVAGSLIETKRGIVPIESINVDDYVLTTGGYKRVLDSGISGRDVIKSKFNIHTVYYTIIECTPNHLIRTFNTWTEAEKIKEGEMIYLSRTSMGKGITSIQVRDIILEELKDFIELSGSFIHQKKSLMDIMYTILMEILKIIGLKISNYLNLMSIYLLMLQSITKTRVKQQENTCKILEVLQKSGISLKKDGSGIETMPISQDLVHILLQRGLVNTVHETSWQQTTITVSALLNVKQNLIESQIIPLLKSIALSVVNYLLVENFNIRNIVPTVVKKITKYDTKRVDKVYDLTIEDFSEFFVNGVLVHNSIDALRYLANWFYEDYAKKIHLTIPTEVANISPERALYYQQLEYYNKFVKPIHEENAKDSTIFGVKLKGINKNNIKGFRR
jgi:hypothetical protein